MNKKIIIGIVLMLMSVSVFVGCIGISEDIKVETIEGKIYDLRERKSYTVVYFETEIQYQGVAIAFSNLAIDDYLQLEYYLLKNSSVCVTYNYHIVERFGNSNYSYNKFISVNEVK